MTHEDSVVTLTGWLIRMKRDYSVRRRAVGRQVSLCFSFVYYIIKVKYNCKYHFFYSYIFKHCEII